MFSFATSFRGITQSGSMEEVLNHRALECGSWLLFCDVILAILARNYLFIIAQPPSLSKQSNNHSTRKYWKTKQNQDMDKTEE